MLTDEQLEVIGSRLVGLYQQLERDVIADIVRRLANTGRLTETAELMAQSLREKGYSPARIYKEVMRLINADGELRKEIAKNTLEAKRALNRDIQALRKEAAQACGEVMHEAADMAFRGDLSMWRSGALPVKGEAFERLTEAMAKRAADVLMNLTKTTAFRTSTGATVKAERMYAHQLNVALVKMTSGAYSYRQAMEEAIRELSKSGLRTVDYESGASRQLDTAVRNALMTASSQLSGEITMRNVRDTGVNHVEVTAHWGAREGEGHANHAAWQGKVYCVEGTDGVYENLEAATGYPSDPTGLKGYNCRHEFYPFFVGISEPTEWEAEPPPVEVNGKTYTYYQATQEQRRREREIRALKREEAALREAGFDEKAKSVKSLIRTKTAEYKQFSEAVGIRVKTERLRVLDGDSSLSYNTSKRVQKALDEQAQRINKARTQMAAMPKNVSSGHQGKHVRGSRNFDETRSELTYDAQVLIDLYAETAEPILDSKGEWTHKSRFAHSESIGISRMNGQPDIPTKSGIMHYSKKGIHIVPSRPSEQKE
jgi:hypothetical protein